MSKEELYYELFELYKKRVKTKHLTMEAYNFERKSASNLERVAELLSDRLWDVIGYFPFKVYHPQREINAPMYVDRIAEQWFVEKYIQPLFVPRLFEFNMACQAGKGPFLTMDYVKASMDEMYQMYGNDWYVFQYDCEGYFDNICHSAAKEIIKEIGPGGFWIYEKIVDSFSVETGYAALADIEGKEVYGYPKGTLPSQWTGIILLNELDLRIHDNPTCDFNIRYMDDGLNFFHLKDDCRRCYEDTKQYLVDKNFGIRLHPRKTYYAPISRGFTFCGWRYTQDPDGKIHVRIKNNKKKEMEARLKTISDEVRRGKMSLKKANTIRDGMFEYLSHGTESGPLIGYMRNQYPFPRK